MDWTRNVTMHEFLEGSVGIRINTREQFELLIKTTTDMGLEWKYTPLSAMGSIQRVIYTEHGKLRWCGANHRDIYDHHLTVLTFIDLVEDETVYDGSCKAINADALSALFR